MKWQRKNLDEPRTLPEVRALLDEAITLGQDALFSGGISKVVTSANLSRMSVTQARLLFLVERAMGVRSQLLFSMATNGSENGPEALRTLLLSPFGVTLIWRTYLSIETIAEAVLDLLDDEE